MPSLLHLLLVGIGGFAGSTLRYTLTHFIVQISTMPHHKILATVVVNMVGSFFIGFVAAEAGVKFDLNFNERLLIFTGIFGGFTTFSSFTLDSYYLFSQNLYLLAALNLIGQPLLGFLMVWLGFRLGRL